MSSLCIIGAQWGDEGKGKLVDYLTKSADVVVRFQGGNNAGHTLMVGDMVLKLRLVPSGILRESTRCMIAAGVVLNPFILLEEIDQLQKIGISPENGKLLLDRNCHLVLPYHEMLDRARETQLDEAKIGTTGKGIGPAYEDQANRSGIRLAELFDVELLRSRLKQQVQDKNLLLEKIFDSSDRCNFEELYQSLLSVRERILPLVGNVGIELERQLKANKRVVFEGAQGAMLDKLHGTLPYVTSSHTISGAALTGCGLGPKAISHTLGVVKGYSTRVGEGPFPTEMESVLAESIREKGGEYGTVTGRARRCGWLDAFAIKKALRLNGCDSLAVTKLDVLSGMEKVKICINYRINGEKLEDLPALVSDYAKVIPEYIELPGWDDSIAGARKWHQLPPQARFYLSTLSEIVGCPVSIVSVGAEREATLFSNLADFVFGFCAVER